MAGRPFTKTYESCMIQPVKRDRRILPAERSGKAVDTMAKFCPLKTAEQDQEALSREYAAGREIGVVRLGEAHLFFRKGRKVYYLSYSEMDRCFRRVMLVTSKLCCGRGDIRVENLVVCSGGRELAVIQLPGTRAAEMLLEELKPLAPHARFTNQ